MLFILVSGSSLPAQEKKTEHFEQLWFQYFNQTTLNNRWSIWFDAGYRTRDNFTQGTSTTLVRVGAIYQTKVPVRLMGGYAFFNAYPLEEQVHVAQPEHRLWQQFLWQPELGRILMTQTIRFEQRWRRNLASPDELADDYHFNYRLRFGLGVQIPLREQRLKKGDLSLVLHDEVMLNFGKQIVYNYFDQNRIAAGFRYYFSGNLNLQLLYMNAYTKTAIPELYRIFSTIRISFFQTISL